MSAWTEPPLPGLEATENGPGAPQSVSGASDGLRVHRRPGWALVGAVGVDSGVWHRPQARVSGDQLITVCGLVGRYLADHEREIICCPTCAESEPPM